MALVRETVATISARLGVAPTQPPEGSAASSPTSLGGQHGGHPSAAERPAPPIVHLVGMDGELSTARIEWARGGADRAPDLPVTWTLYRSEYDPRSGARVRGTTVAVVRTSTDTAATDHVPVGRAFGYTVVASMGLRHSSPSLIAFLTTTPAAG